VILFALRDCILSGVPASNDVNVKVSANDQVTAYLEDKITAGDCLTITKINIGADEELVIAPKISAVGNNALQCLVDGLYVEIPASGTPTTQAIVNETDTNTIDMNVNFNGTETYTVSGNVRLDTTTGGNRLVSNPGYGLYVPPVPTVTPININQCVSSATITQNVGLVGSTYTICNEVNIPSLLSSDAGNALVMGTDSKLFVPPAVVGADYVSNVAVAGGIMTFTGVGSGFGGPLPIISTDGGNVITAGTDGAAYYAGGSPSQLQIEAGDTCPADYLDDKFENPVTVLNPTGTLPGVGAFVWPNIIGDSTCSGAGSDIRTIVSVEINAIVYTNLSGIVITSIQDIVDTLQWIIDNNAALSSANCLASSENAGATGIPPTQQDIYWFGNSSDTVEINYTICSSHPAVQNVVLTGTYNEDIIINTAKINIYKRTIDDGAGCLSLEFFGYENPIAVTETWPAVDVANVTVLGYAATTVQVPTLYLDINEPIEPGMSYVIDIAESTGTLLLTDFLLKGDNTAIIPLPNHNQVDDIDITIRRQGYGKNISGAVIKTKVGGIQAPQSAWQAVPPAALVTSWAPGPNGLKYRIVGADMYFKGEMVQTFDPAVDFPPSLTTGYQVKNEVLFNIALIDATYAANYMTGDVYHYGITDRRNSLFVNSGGALLDEDYVPHVFKDGANMSVDIYWFNDSANTTGGTRDITVSLSSVVVREG
jgi:hypothetical protein